MMQQHLLVFRFSSLGDVAMTVPVIQLLLDQHPGLVVTMVSTEFMRPLFSDMERVQFHAADLKGKHKGLPGLFRLYRELKTAYGFDAIADLHNVLRTKVLTTFFSFSGKPISVIDKGRKEKKELTRSHGKKLRQLKTTFQRYADVFNSLGYPVDLEKPGGIRSPGIPGELSMLKQQGKLLVGIAPFALHREKTYPPERMQEVIKLLNRNANLKIYLLGGKRDAAVLDQWSLQNDNVECLAGKMDLQKELQYISSFNLVVSMDSANMHLASMYGVPVVSVWGGTHPYLGFYGWKQPYDNAVQVELECRPSSVFGNKPCRNHLKCMEMISPLVVYERIIAKLNLEHYEIPGR